MAKNKVMHLWTAIVTAFLALCTALGLATATTAAAAPRTGTPSESPSHASKQHTAPTVTPAHHRTWPHARALPPTMKQRIRAEAHGKSPRCRSRSRTPLTDLTAREAETRAPHRFHEEPDGTDQRTLHLDC